LTAKKSAPATDIPAITKRLRQAVSKCSSEEDLRVEMEFILREALPELPKGKYEKALKTSTFTGRLDAIHQGVVIEYKKPKLLRSASEREKALGQLCGYLETLALDETAQPDAEAPAYTQEQEEKLVSNVGLATDGSRFIFVQRRARKWHLQTRELDEDTTELLLVWLRAMQRKGLSPENLLADFGPQTEHAASVVSVLAQLVQSDSHPKANVVFNEWKRIFGIVYGEEQLHRTSRADETKALTVAYKLDLGVEFPVLLFAIHTYYALLMKLLATEVIVSQGGLGNTFVGTLTRGELKVQLARLESGEILEQLNFRNVIEQDFFGWYPEAWSKALENALWSFVQTLKAYDVASFQLEPDRARDLLKDLYHGLIPESVRHALGEYYTPDWLAEHTVALAGYDGDPRKAFLDPSCGSGTFLIQAIRKARQWLADHSVQWGTPEKKAEAIELIRHNIVGFDLNPLAVIASRTNYLFALRPLLAYRKSTVFEIPVYLTDSVLLPGRVESQTDLFSQDTVPFPMTVGTFHLPQEVVHKRRVSDLMNLLHGAISHGHSQASFVARAIRELGLSSRDVLQASLGALFGAMKALDDEGKNRIWAKLIRNRYAALFFHHHFDFVVGNPPHVGWEALTPEWRKAAEKEYQRYGLFTLAGLESRHGGGKKDIAALFTYAVIDHFLRTGGVFAMVLHVSLVKTSGAGEGFRRFQLGDGEPFAVDEAHDFRRFQPFQTHAKMRIKTRTLTLRAVKGKRTKYPIPYHVWTKTQRGFIPGGLTWEEAAERLASEEQVATPLRGSSGAAALTPWLTVPKAKIRQARKVIAPRNYDQYYRGREGVNTGGLNGAYFVEVVERHHDGTSTVRNLYDAGKIKCPKVQAPIESDLLYPVLRGRSIARWSAQPFHHIILVQDPTTQRGYEEEWLQQTHPFAWAYFKRFEELLRARKAYRKFYEPSGGAFYSMYSVTQDTLASHKVVWMDISETMKGVVLSEKDEEAAILPEHSAMFAPVDSEEEAHYLCAVVNSEAFNTVVTGYAVDNHLSTHPLENILIPRFDPRDAVHAELSEFSVEAHKLATDGDSKQLRRVEKKIDKTAKMLW
jgi:hypothetical protein